MMQPMTPKDFHDDLLFVLSPLALVVFGLFWLPDLKLVSLGLLIQTLALLYAIAYYRKHGML